MDFITFKEKIGKEELKNVEPNPQGVERIIAKYKEVDILGAYRLNANHTCILFKHVLWEKMAIYRDGDWLVTRVNSLKNQLPDETMSALKKLYDDISIIKVESVLPSEGIFYYYIIAKIEGKKYVLHLTKEGEVLQQTRFLDYTISIDENGDEVDFDEDEEDEEDELDEEMEFDEDGDESEY